MSDVFYCMLVSGRGKTGIQQMSFEENGFELEGFTVYDNYFFRTVELKLHYVERLNKFAQCGLVILS